MVFCDRVSKFVHSLSVGEEVAAMIESELIKLALQVQEGKGSIKLRKIAHQFNFLSDFSHFKNTFLDVSEYIHRKLWVQTHRYLVGESVDPAYLEDVEYCLSKLGEAEKAKLISVNINANDIGADPMTWKMGKAGKRDLIKHCKSKIYPLSYISNYDPAFQRDDFVQELIAEALKVRNMYPRSKGTNIDNAIDKETCIKMYVEKALNNKVRNIQEYYSCDSRRRVSTTDHDKYRRREKIKRGIKANPEDDSLKEDLKTVENDLRTSNSDYYSTVSSINYSSDDSEKTFDISDSHMVDVGFSDHTYGSTLMENIWTEDAIMKMEKFILTNFLKLAFGEEKPEIVGPLPQAIKKQLDLDPHSAAWIKSQIKDPSVRRSENLDDYDVEHLDSVISKMYKDLPDSGYPKVCAFVRVLVGDFNPEFESWAQDGGKKTENIILMIEAAKKFFGFSRSKLQKNPAIRAVINPELLSFIGGQ